MARPTIIDSFTVYKIEQILKEGFSVNELASYLVSVKACSIITHNLTLHSRAKTTSQIKQVFDIRIKTCSQAKIIHYLNNHKNYRVFKLKTNYCFECY
jgi:hypothetical protein